MKIFFKILAIFLLIIALVFNFWLNHFSALVSVVLSLLMAGILSSIFRFTFKSWKHFSFRHIFTRVMLILWGIYGFFIAVIFAFIGYQNYINPVNLPNVTLENSSWQKIIFSQMMHIAKENFYSQKNISLKNFSENGFILLDEWVRGGSIESQEKINAIMGFDFTKNGYNIFSDILGLSHQNREILYAGISPEKIISVDVTLDDVVNSIENNNQQTEPLVLASDIEFLQNSVAKMTPNEKKFMQYLVYAFINFYYKKIDSGALEMENGIDKNFLNAVLYQRNQPVIDYIQKNPEQNIVVVYGALHFDGIFQELKKHDATWKIQESQPFFPLK